MVKKSKDKKCHDIVNQPKNRKFSTVDPSLSGDFVQGKKEAKEISVNSKLKCLHDLKMYGVVKPDLSNL